MKKRIALQMWSLRDEQKVDFTGTVKTVKKIGFDGVELAGYGNLDANGAKQALEDAGLAVSGMHVGFQQLKTDLNQVIEDAYKFKTKDLICPYLHEFYFNSASAAEAIGEQLDGFGHVLRQFGLRLSFHNHAAELRVFDGKTAFEWLLGAARSRNLGAEVDVYWVEKGGQSAPKFLKELGKRCNHVHLKDETEIGTGPVDFKAVKAVVDEMSWMDWVVLEQERYNHAPLESVRMSFDKLKSWGW